MEFGKGSHPLQTHTKKEAGLTFGKRTGQYGKKELKTVITGQKP